MNKKIKSSGELAKEAFTYLKQIQTGEKPILKTGQDFIDCHIGGCLPSDVIIICANSGVGKTKLLFDTLDLILDEKVNTNADKFVSLEFSLEMLFLNRILRDTNKLLKKSKTNILQEEFEENERLKVLEYYKGLQDGRRFICEDTVTTQEFYNMTKAFCEQHRDKDAIIISLDHVLNIRQEDRNEDTAKSLTLYINELRKEFNNVYFILLTQFNRSSFANIADRNNDMVPRASMIYGSSHFEFLSSYIIGIMDPFKMGVTEFMKVNKERYDWLEEYMTDEDKKGKVSFLTVGNMFYFVLKSRESDVPYKSLFIRPMDLTEEQLEKMKSEYKEEPAEEFVPVFDSGSLPVFNPEEDFDVEDYKKPF